ncbi:Protein of unknown function [Streptomyces sp. AmelKG-E11A]|nr:Protein of unknown function [Streptomyces sp. AmelKG-E11A]
MSAEGALTVRAGTPSQVGAGGRGPVAEGASFARAAGSSVAGAGPVPGAGSGPATMVRVAGRLGKQSVRNMVLSLGVTVLFAGVIWLFLPHDEDGDPVKAIDYRVELITARRAAPYPIAAPEGLSKEWKPTSVRYRSAEASRWHLGFRSPDGKYVAIEQSTEKPRVFAEQASRGARKTDATQTIDGRVWEKYEGERYDALVLTEGDATTVITGSASFTRLAMMAGALTTKA